MFAAFRSARRKSIRSTVASFALAIAISGGVAMGSTVVLPDVAHAQENSPGFAEVYQPIAAMVQPDVADFQGARAQIPALIAAVENDVDRDLAGNLILNIGSNLEDRELQRQGLIMRLDSGRVAPEQLGLFNWFAGNLSYEAGNWADARRYLQASRDLGHQPDSGDAVLLVAGTYIEEDAPQSAISYLLEQAEAVEAAGGTVNENWLLNALQHSYDNELAGEAVAVGEKLVALYPTQRNWANALQIVNQLHELEPAVRVDLYRLMRLTEALTERQDLIRYIEDLDPRVMANEVQMVLARGLDSGVFTTSDPYYTEVSNIAEARAPQDRDGIGTIVAEGESGDALDALGAGDVLYSLSDFERAERLYQMALDKGYDADTARTRIGIAQAQQGDYAAALETFGQVRGQRQPIARMWAAYATSQMN